MLVIRDKQMTVLQQDVVERFEQSLAAHLMHFAPRESRALGRNRLLTVVRLGRQRTEQYELANRESIRLYIELMFLLGSGFSTDPQYPWAAEALGTSWGTADEGERANTLHTGAIRYLHSVFGPKREYVSSALTRLLEHRPGDLLGAGHLPESLIERLSLIFPEKCAYIGQDGMQMLIYAASAAAEKHGLMGAQAAVLFTILMFVFGHEADRDPVNPWVEQVLRETAFMEPSIRIERLEHKIWEELRDGMG
jgi:hypothetical protein